MSVTETQQSVDEDRAMEEGQAGQVRAGASDDSRPDAASEKNFVVNRADSQPATSTAEQEAPVPGILRRVSNRWHFLHSEEFDKHVKEVQERREQWAKAVDHVKIYLKNKEALEGPLQPIVDDDDDDGPRLPPGGPPPEGDPNQAIPPVLPPYQEELYGYPRIARILGSDDRWLMCRRFGSLQARLILEKQDEIRELELEIENYDYADVERDRAENDPAFDRLTTRRRPDPKEREQRQELMDRAGTKYKEYAALVAAARELTCFERPVNYEFSTVEKAVLQAGAMRPSEMDWILNEDRRGDVISLRGPKEHASIGAMIEKSVNRLRNSRIFNHDANADNTWLQGNATTERWAKRFVSALLFLLVPIMFVIPVYLLSRIGDSIGRSIGVLIGFALLFTFVLDRATPARPHEVLSGAAAYMAVLVVFIGSVVNHNGTS